MTRSRLQTWRILSTSSKRLRENRAYILILLCSALVINVEPASAQAPDVTGDGASYITATSATINGTVNPHSLSTIFHVNYGLTAAYGYSGSYAPVWPLGNTPVVVSNKLTGLSANTTYHCQLVATNDSGIGSSVDMTFTTLSPQPPTVTVNGPGYITSTNASIIGIVSANGAPTGYYVQWGLTTAYGGGGPVGSLSADTNGAGVTAWMLGLSPSTTYHYRLAATNSAGTGYSADLALTTSNSPPPPPPPGPSVTTQTAQGVTATNGAIYGAVNPNGLPTTYYFQWGNSVAYGNFTPPVLLPGQNSISYVSEGLTGLTPATTYHYRLVATNSAGSTLGADQAFTTMGLLIVNGNAFSYVVTNGAVTIMGFNGPGGNVIIPSTIDGLPVTAIGKSAFFYTTLTNVTIPKSVTSIGDSAFSSCQYLNSIAIPDSVTNLGDSAFLGCVGLESLTIGKGITTIRGGGDTSMYGTFMGCGSLTRLVIPDNVTNISNGPIHLGGSLGAFYGCSGLTNVIIGKGLAFLGTGAFSYCTGLTGIYFKGDAPTPGVNMFGEDIFHVDNLATIYYLPGTTGWGPTYAGVPTALWNPQLIPGANFGVQGNEFGFNISGTEGIPLVIEASTSQNDQSWTALQSCTLTNGQIYFKDPDCKNYPARFYRIRSP